MAAAGWTGLPLADGVVFTDTISADYCREIPFPQAILLR